MTTDYEPSDGDYIGDDEADYTKFFNDIQTEAKYDFGEYLEIYTTLEEDNTIRVLGANDDGDDWEWERSFPVPQGWDMELVKRMFEGTVYLEPSNRQDTAVDEDWICEVCGDTYLEHQIGDYEHSFKGAFALGGERRRVER